MACNCNKSVVLFAKENNFHTDVKDFCVDCKHEKYGMCNRFTSVVTGEMVEVKCADARSNDKLCGYYGILFEKKEEPKYVP